jgi:hypothetical protein
MYRKPNIVTIKVRKLEWIGHLVRMSDNRTVKYYWGIRWKKESRKTKNMVAGLH